jgi:hypothetical protein
MPVLLVPAIAGFVSGVCCYIGERVSQEMESKLQEVKSQVIEKLKEKKEDNQMFGV